ncbi:MAG: acyl-CoA dehydrogenase family protein [Dehalococcoidia bacterium]
MLTLDEAVSLAGALRPAFAATAAAHDRAATFPHENLAALREAGLLALTCRPEWGGDGLGVEAAVRVVESVARGEPSTALVLAMQYIHHGAPARHGLWNAVGLERMTREAVSDGALLNVMRVEPELGTPTRGGTPATVATRTATGWRIRGRKLYATGGPGLAYFITFCAVAGDEPAVGWFAVPAGAKGLSLVETWDHLGMRATGSHDLLLEDVEIPEEFGLQWWSGAGGALEPYTGVFNNLVIAAVYHGVAKAARDWLVAYLHERKPSNLGASLATLPRMQAAVGDLETLLFTSDRLLYGLASEVDAGRPSASLGVQTSQAKYVVTENAIKAVEIGLRLVGNPGLSRRNPLERHYRDVLCGRVHVPQEDMVQAMAGRAALGAR